MPMRSALWSSAALMLLLLAGCSTMGPAGDPTTGPAPTVPATPAQRQQFSSAVTALTDGRYDAAASGFQQLTEERPDLKSPWVNWALALHGLGRDAEALDLLKRAAAQHPDYAPIHHQLGIVLRRVGQFTAARAAYARALELQPDLAVAHRNLGLLCDLYLHDLDCALAEYRTYQALNESEEVALWIADLERRLP